MPLKIVLYQEIGDEDIKVLHKERKAEVNFQDVDKIMCSNAYCNSVKEMWKEEIILGANSKTQDDYKAAVNRWQESWGDRLNYLSKQEGYKNSIGKDEINRLVKTVNNCIIRENIEAVSDYSKDITTALDKDYHKFEVSLAGDSVSKNIEKDYKFIKEKLNDAITLCKNRVLNHEEQVFIQRLSLSFDGDKEVIKMAFKSLTKENGPVFDKTEDFKAMYFPEGAVVLYLPDLEDRNEVEYVRPVYVFIQERWNYKNRGENRKVLLVFNSRWELVKEIVGWHAGSFEVFDPKNKERSIKNIYRSMMR